MSNTPTLQVYREVGAKELKRGSDGAAGLDIAARLFTDDGDEYDLTILPGDRCAIPTGIHVAIPEGHYGRVAPRSGLAYKYGLDVLAGVIDCDYRGEIKVIVLNTGDLPVHVSNHERIAQLIIEKIAVPVMDEVDTLSELGNTDRGSGGFGSTGRL